MKTTRENQTACIGTLIAALSAWALIGCETSQPETKVVVPSAATQAPEYEGDGSVPEQRYVIRMSDGERDWEVQFPEVATGYEMHIPLEDQKKKGAMDSVHWEAENLTEADKELLKQLRRDRGQMEREGIYEGGEHVNDQVQPGSGQQQQGQAPGTGSQQSDQQLPSGEELEQSDKQGQADQQGQKQKQRGEQQAAPYRPSYLLGIENVRKLYKAGKYELAMVRLKKLEEAYPDDEQILSMKGTLWLKLGREKLARKAWERVLQINPDNKKVKEALQRLNQSE